MAIPTFNDGDKLSIVRLNSLNPTVDKVNEIEKAIGNLQTFDQGVVPGGTKSLTSLDSGWWFVSSKLSITSKPPGVLGDFIFYKQVVTGDTNNPRNGVIVAYGYSQVGSRTIPTIWTRYKIGTTWTPWASGGREISDLTQEIGRVKDSVPKMSEIEKYLIDQGWEKNGTKPPVVPVRVEKPTIYATYSNVGPSSLANMASSTTGTVRLTRGDTSNKRIIIVVKSTDADKVGTISVDGGLGSNWITRETRIEGNAYRVFYSSGAYTETSNTVKVNFI